jgi:hypothetical protein
LRALLSFLIFSSFPYQIAQIWLEGSYARIIYPDANLSDDKISEFLSRLGDEYASRAFFEEYLKYVATSMDDGKNILVAGSGFLKTARFPGVVCMEDVGEFGYDEYDDEVRIIYATRQETGLPIFLRHCSLNMDDSTAILGAVADMKELGANADLVILDFDDYDDSVMSELYAHKIPFITKLSEKTKLHDRLAAENVSSLERKENWVSSEDGGGTFVKRLECELVAGRKGYARVCLHAAQKPSETHMIGQMTRLGASTKSALLEKVNRLGVFVLASSRPFAAKKILALWRRRRDVEKAFEITKKSQEMVPIHYESASAVSGHLLLTFLARASVEIIRNKLGQNDWELTSFFSKLNNQKCEVFDRETVVQKYSRIAKECFKLLELKCPLRIKRTDKKSRRR